MKKVKIPLLNFYLYTLLLIVTPFLLLQNYMQTAIGVASRASVDLGFVSLPYVVIIGAVLLLLFFIYYLKKFNKIRWISLALIIAMFAAGQLISDYYFGHRFYDLQHNWHYFAYGIFAYIAYRRFSLKNRPLHLILLRIFLFAFCISLFDEIVQVYISGRVFDLHDVAKDMWGNMIGVVFVFFFIRGGQDFKNFKVYQPKIRQYFTNPFSFLILELIFAFVFLSVSSLLAESEYWRSLILVTLLVFLIFFILHLISGKKILRLIILSVILLVIVWMLYASFKQQKSVSYVASSYVKFNGIPLIYFDYMIYPDGGFRPVNKKKHFVLRDKLKINDIAPDILLIGTGNDNSGGKGWNDLKMTELLYNAQADKLFQIIKQPNPKACETYNRLLREKKKVLFIIHNP